MTSVTIAVEVPDGVNPDWIVKECEELTSRVARDAQRKVAREIAARKVYESDAELERWVAENLRGQCVVRALTYGEVERRQEFSMHLHGRYQVDDNIFFGQHDPRRPVLMRGSIPCMAERHARSYACSDNGLAADIFKRWVRRKRVTAFSWAEWDKATTPAVRWLQNKFTVSHHFEKMRMEGPGDCGNYRRVIVFGRTRYLTHAQVSYIKSLYQIHNNTTKLDDKRALLLGAQTERFEEEMKWQT